MKAKIITVSLVIILTIGLVSCKKSTAENKYDKIQKMDWLIGNWENKLSEGILTETWSKENDSTYSGKSYFIKNEKDTIHSESIVLTQSSGELIYRPTVKGQNNDESVDFKLIPSESESTFTFENQAHNYPKTIAYKKISNTSLIVTISGNQQGKPSTESYPMTKK